MDLIKEYIEKLNDVEVVEGNTEGVKTLLRESRQTVANEVENILKVSKEGKEIELRSAMETTLELKDLIREVDEKLSELESELAEEEAKEVDEEVNEEVDAEVDEEVNEEEQRSKRGKVEERGADKMAKVEFKNAGNKQKELELRSYVNFLKTRSITDGLKTTDNEVVVVEDDKVEVDLEFEDNLVSLVNVQKVTGSSGTVHVLENNGPIILQDVEELAESPQIGLLKTKLVNFLIKTKRAYAPISFEAIDDAGYILDTANTIVKRANIDTKNNAIITALNDSDEIETENITDIADLISTGLDSQYAKGFVLSKTQYNNLARMKDSEGRYYLHNDLSKPVGKTILGYPVAVLGDDVIGADSAYFGDFKSAVVLFDRKEMTVVWDVWMHYGKCLSPIVRFDVKVVNPKALVKLNFVVSADEGEVEEG